MRITVNKDHIYKVDGIVYPGVSEAMQFAGLVDTRWYNDQGCIRGSYVHKAIQLYHTQGLNFNSLDKILIPYIDAYLDFLKATEFCPVLIEEMSFSPLYKYCGRPDLIGYMSNDLVLIDIKTGSVPDWVGVQTAAYKFIWDGKIDNKNISKRFALNLKNNGKWSLIPLKNKRDIDVFLAALTIYNYKKGLI